MLPAVMVPLFASIVLSCCSTSQESAGDYSTTTSESSQSSEKVTVPSGTTVIVALDQRLRTDVQKTGDEFTAHTTTPVVIDQMVVFPEGSLVRGRLAHVEEPHRSAGKAQMTLSFEEIVDASGQTRSLPSELIALKGAGDEISDEEKLAGGAVIGGIIGALTSRDRTKGAAVGAAAGAAAGGAIALATKGDQLELPEGQRFSVQLTQSIRVPVASFGMQN